MQDIVHYDHARSSILNTLVRTGVQYAGRQAREYVEQVTSTDIPTRAPTRARSTMAPSRIKRVKIVAPQKKVHPQVKKYVKDCCKKAKELKRHDLAISQSITTSGTSCVLLNAIVGGYTDSSRVGNEITLSHIQARLQFYNNAATAIVPPTIRFLIFSDSRPTGALIDMNEVTTDNTVNGLFPNPTWPGRFKIHYDHTFKSSNQDQVTPANAGILDKVIRINRKLSLPIRYEDGSGTIDKIAKNPLMLMMIMDGSSTEMSVTGNFRCNYYDK